jgi:hypothetical protein
MAGLAPVDSSFALLMDGTAVEIREMGRADVEAVRRLHRDMSPDSLYLRSFGLGPRGADETSARLCREPSADYAVLGAWLAGDLVGVADYELTETAAIDPERYARCLDIVAADAGVDALITIVARPDGVVAVDARIRIIPQRRWDPYLRRLR